MDSVVLESYIEEVASNRDGKYRTERSIRKHLPEFAAYIDDIESPEDMGFNQKLWHILNKDFGFALGKCYCGARTRFKDNKYKTYCSNKCAMQSDEVKTRISKTLQSQECQDKAKATNIERYGKEYSSQNDDVKDKARKTVHSQSHKDKMIERYGKEYAQQNDEVRKKISESLQSQECRDKTKATNIERYGKEYAQQNDEVRKKMSQSQRSQECRDKTKATCNARYGVDNVSQNADIREKMSQSHKTFEYEGKMKTSCIERYGVDNVMKSPMIREKIKATNIERYGTPYASQSPMIQEKINNTKRMNHTFNTSSIEEDVCEWLDENDIRYERQYKSKEYPYNCDFYLIDYQLFIEIQASWTHGGFPYSEEEDRCKEQLDVWRQKSIESDFYKNAIYVWTTRDVEKRKTAAANNIKYIEIFESDSSKAIDRISAILYESIFDMYYSPDNFPYPYYTESMLIKEWEALRDSRSDKLRGKNGIRIINMFHKSLWKANVGKCLSPYKAWGDADIMKRIFYNRIEYDKILIKDINIDIFNNRMRDGMSVTKRAPKVSVFSPSLASILIKRYLSECQTITDPFSGFSGRMLGAISNNKRYIGYDASKYHVEESNDILKWLSTAANVDIYGSNVEVKDILDEIDDVCECECILTCPPYNMKEHWEGCDLKDKDCDEWIDIVMHKYKAKRYVFIVDSTLKYEKYIVDKISNKSHFSDSKEYILVID